MTRRLGLLLCGLGLALLAWVAVTLAWGDPITSLYTRHEQHALSRRLDQVERSWQTTPRFVAPSKPARSRAAPWRAGAVRYAHGLHDGDPVGRIVIPRLHLDMVVVQGTSTSDLERGPGHYDAGSGRATSLPGLGGVVAIAGHRTTFLHPFRHIDDLRPDDVIRIEMPYGTFTYRVTGHRIVASSDWTILRPRPWEKLVLTACHPLYSASHRYVVFARLAGQAFPRRGLVAARPSASPRSATSE